MQLQRDTLPAAERLRIAEVFVSLQGEALTAGIPTQFIRLTGCPLRCQYCDTAYAFTGGEWQSIDDLVASALASGVSHVCVTGGEPLSQSNCLTLLARLCDEGLSVSLETSGAVSVAAVDTRVSKVLDLKTPGSGEEPRNIWDNLQHLTAHDQIKFVICDRADYDWALQRLELYRLDSLCPVFFSPSHEQLEARELADWLVKDRAPVRLQLQLHKYLWGNSPGH